MATIKVKLRHSSVENKTGTIYYQLTHRRKNQQITTDIHLLPEQWDSESKRVARSAENAQWLQNA